MGYMHSDDIRTLFSKAMSDMYRTEVPKYGTLLDLVADVNNATLAADPLLKKRLEEAGELERLGVERHGAIRLGTASELFNIRRMFAIMGMYPVGYYDLAVAGIPVHSTAFRPVDDEALARNPFRVFTSLLRLELIEDKGLAEEAERILSGRQIMSERALELIGKAEAEGGLSAADAEEFVAEALKTFRWHSEATVSKDVYQRLHEAHRLIADVVSFSGPHINHLTPRTLDIDAVQKGMPERGIAPKAIIEGPPRRVADILLRQTSFKALEEAIVFKADDGGAAAAGTHTARFGEIEQRGVALTPKGRALYDEMLQNVRRQAAVDKHGAGASVYDEALAEAFKAFPDGWDAVRREGLAYFRYRARMDLGFEGKATSVEALIEDGALVADPQVYEDFLPVSAAGIFQSNLGTDAQSNYSERASQDGFEKALGDKVQDANALYSRAETDSLAVALERLGQAHLLPDLRQRA